MTNKEKILQAAMVEFTTTGYTKTSVNKLIAITKLSKGTFYHYFRSKEEVLDMMIDQFITQLKEQVQKIIKQHQDMQAIDLLTTVLISLNIQNEHTETYALIHTPENALLHQKFNVALLHHLTPDLIGIIEKGIDEHVFSVQEPQVMIEILFLSQALFDEGMFTWTSEQKKEKIHGITIALERLLGAQEGSFIEYQNYLSHLLLKENSYD